MSQQKQDNTIAIVGIVLGGLGFLLSLIPCVGFVGVPLGIIGLILGLVAFFKARDNGDNNTLSIVALTVSVLPMIISGFYFMSFKNVVGDFDTEIKMYSDCEHLIADIKVLEAKMDSLERILEDEDGGSKVFGTTSKLIKMAVRIGKMQEQSNKLDCNYEFKEVDVRMGGNKSSGRDDTDEESTDEMPKQEEIENDPENQEER